nr:hypothetical protein [Tanacetum cinerariifolium]
MDTTIDQQVTRDEALVPHAKILRIERSNFRLLSVIKSKESTLQLMYDVLRLTPFFKAFMVTADVSKIYMQEFWATTIVHHHSIRFKMDNKKHIVNLESFREMLRICPRLPHQPYVEPPFEEESLSFLWFLGHSEVIRKLIDVNINKLHQPWRSFAAIINKCLTEKSSGYDSLRLSQAQILWGLYHKRNVDFAYLMWEDFIYQVEHKDTKKSSEMYYPWFTKVIIHHFMSKDPSIPRRNKVNWHYVRDDHMFSTIKLVYRHQNTQQFGALLPIELTNEDIKNYNTYKEYYAVATGVTPPKPKASIRKTRSSFDTTITPPTATAGPRLTTSEKGKQAAKASKAKSLYALYEVAMTEAQHLKLDTKRSLHQIHISQASGSGTDEGTGTLLWVPDVPTDESEEEISWNSTDKEGDDDEGKDGDGDDDDELRDEESFDPIPKTPEDTDDEGNGEENIVLNVGRVEGHDEEEEEDELCRDVNINQGRGIQTTQEVKDSHVTLTPVNPDGQQQSSSRMNEAVKVAVQLQSDRLCDEAQADNDEFLKTIDENMQKIIKEQVKEQVKVQVSKILPKIEQTMNEQLEAEVLTRSSNSSKTSYAIAADLSEMELMKILIKKIEGNKSIDQFNKQRNLYKALVDAYESDKIILDTYEDTVTLKRRRDDDADKDEEPSAGPDRGSKRRREGKEPESASAPQETATRSAGRVDTLTPKVLAGPTYELMRGSCKSMVELEYQLEEVYKSTTDKLDWVNPEVIQRRVEDLQLGVESYQKKLNLTKPDTYRSDLKRKEAYIAYSNPRGFIYQNKDKKNRLMRIDELDKFSDGTFIDVRTALDDRLKGIRMQYPPQSIWRKSDKDRAAAIIQEI